MQVEATKFVSGIRKGKRIPQIVSDYEFLFFTEIAYEKLKARGGIFIYSNAQFESKDLSICQRNPQTNLKTLVNCADVKIYLYLMIG